MSAPLLTKTSQKNENKKRKREDTQQDHTGNKIAKPHQPETFTEVEFKVLLRNSSSIFTGLEKFTEAAERWPSDTQYDVVAGFLRTSPECSEIFQILEGGKRKVQELQLIFRCFEKILLRIAEDLDKYHSNGLAVVRKLLSTQLNSIYFTLSVRHKSSQIKTALKLLVSMVMLGPVAEKPVLNQIDLNHANIKPLFFRRDMKDEEDVRTCLLHLIVAFLLAGDNEVIRRLADTKGFLANVFQGIVFDRVATIQLLLSTFLEKIITNPVISKTSKVHIFTESSLKQLGQLYNWKGPAKWKDKDKDKTEEEIGGDEDMDEDRQTVAETVHKFLTELCSSYKFGINFMDKTYGTSGRNQNHILTSFLSYLSTISHKTLVQELIVDILVTSPDQLRYFLPQIAHSLSPRATKKWVDSARFLCKIFQAQSDEPHILKSKEHKSVNQVVNVLLIHTLPPLQILNTVIPGVKNKSITISYTSLAVVKVIAHQCVGILKALNDPGCPLRNVCTHEELTDITATFKEAVTKSLPDSLEIFQCLDRLQAMNKNNVSQQIEELAELCQTHPSDVMVRIEQVLCLYQDLNPTLLLDHPVGLVKLLEGVSLVDPARQLGIVATQSEAENQNEAMSGEINETVLLPQLYLLKLLSGTDSRRLPWGKEGQSGHTLMYQLLSMVTQVEQHSKIGEIALQLICKLLKSTGLFDTFSEEIYIWMKHLQAKVSASQNRSDLLTFVSKVIMMYMNNPYPYMDRVADLVSEVVSMETGDAAIDLGKTKLDRQIEEILSMDLEDLENNEEDTGQSSQMVAKRHPFCPVILSAIDHIQKLEVENADLKVYLSSVVLDVFHSQTDPKAFCLVIKQIQGNCLMSGLQDFITAWLPPYKIKKAKKELLSIPDKFQGHLMDYLLGGQGDVPGTMETGSTDLSLTSRQCLLYVKLLLEKDQTETSRMKLNYILEFLTRTLASKNTDVVSEHSHTEINTVLPSEFSELEIKKISRQEELESVYRVIFEHPSVKVWFLAGVDGPSSKPGSGSFTEAKSLVISEFVKNCLIHVKSVGIGINLREELNYYVNKILKYISNETKHSSENTSLVMELLGYLLDFLDAEKSISTLNTVLDLDKENLQRNENVIGITKQIVQNLSSQGVISLGENCVQNLVSLTCKSEDTDLLDSIVDLLQKFPNLSVLCSEKNVAELLKTPSDTRLLEIMITNSVELRRCVETWFMKKTKFTKLNKKRIGRLIVTFLTLQSIASGVPILKQIRVSSFSEAVLHLGSLYMPTILQLCNPGTAEETETQHLVNIFRHFIRLKVIEKKTYKKLEKRLESALELDASLDCHHIQVIQMILGCPATESESHDQDNRRRLLKFCVQGLVKTLKQKDKKNHLVAKKILEVMRGFSQEEIQELGSHWNELTENWLQLLKGCLKYLYAEPGALKLLTDLLPSIYTAEEEVSVSVSTIVAMVMSHSSFLPVMFNEETPEAKEPLLDLLTQLITLRPDCCEQDHIGIYLGSYGATMTLTDQKILRLMHLYEKNGVDFSEFKPFLWGEKAIEYHTLRKSVGPSLMKQPTMAHVLYNLHPGMIAKTILNFPLRRQLQTLEPQEAREYKSLPECYDPCFLLPLFSHLFAPAAVVDCRRFIERDCLGLVFCALSSHDQWMRSAAYHIIERFIDHLDGSRFMEMDQIIYILNLLKDSLGKSRSKLASIVTIFLARAVKVMLKPDDHMYGLLNSFLLLKPNLDILSVPEFYKLFNSSAMEYKIERQWILSLLLDGLRETADYRIFERKYTFKLLQGFYDSDLSDTPTQLKVLQILLSACKERSVVLDLISYHGFLTWMSGAVQKLKPEMTEHVSLFVNILNSLWFTLLEKRTYKPKSDRNIEDKGETTDKTHEDEAALEEREITEKKESVADREVITEKRDEDQTALEKGEIIKKKEIIDPAVTSQVLIVSQALLWYMRDVEVSTVQTSIDTLLSVIDHFKLTSAYLQESNDKLVLPTVSLVDVLLLLFYSATFVPSHTSSKTFMKIITGLGYDGSLLTQAKGAHSKGDNTYKKKRVVTPDISAEMEDENEGKPDDQDNETEVVVKMARQIGDGSDPATEETIKSAVDSKLEVAKAYSSKLISIITACMPENDISREHCAGLVAVISWCLEQLKHVDDMNLLSAITKWIKLSVEVSELLIQVIAAESDISRDVLDRLLDVYTIANNLKVTNSLEDPQSYESIVKDLNVILGKVAAAREDMLTDKAGTVFTRLKQPNNSGSGESEEIKSLTLRKFFLRPETPDNSAMTAHTDEVDDDDKDDDDTSSGETSEVIEFQEFKVTPKVKAYFESRLTKSEPKRTSSDSENPLKKKGKTLANPKKKRKSVETKTAGSVNKKRRKDSVSADISKTKRKSKS